MNDADLVHFFPSEEIFAKADAIFQAQKKELVSLLPEVDIQHVGSCSIPGASGKFDVDIQIRVTQEEFKKVFEIMNAHYDQKHPEIWTDEFVAFSNNKEYLIDLVVTVQGSRYDDFYRVRDALIQNPDLLKEYNDLKKKYHGKPYSEYRKAKIEFLGGNGRVRFLEY